MLLTVIIRKFYPFYLVGTFLSVGPKLTICSEGFIAQYLGKMVQKVNSYSVRQDTEQGIAPSPPSDMP
jgi:hypothetical protein